MRKLLAVLAIVVAQVVPPMPGQQTGTSRNGSDKSAQQRQGDKSATNPPAMVPALKPVESGGNSRGIAREDKEQSVNLTNVPPITIVEKEKTWKDRLFDWGPWVFNFLLVIVGAIGVWLARRTLGEIERQANLLNQQVEDARIVSADNAKTAARTLNSLESQATLLSRQADLMEGQIKEMQEAGKQAARQLGLTERPWVSPTIELVGPLSIYGREASTTVRIGLNNYGKSPAMGIDIRAVLNLRQLGKAQPADEPRRTCEQMAPLPASVPFGIVVFPDAVPPYFQNFLIRGTIDDSITDVLDYTPEIIICVAYRSTMDEAAQHYTGSIYSLSMLDSDEAN